MAVDYRPITAYLDHSCDVARDMRALSTTLIVAPTAEHVRTAIWWMHGEHEGYGAPSLWAELPGWMRDRMQRCGGDLSLGWQGAVIDAATHLAEAAWLIWPEEEA